MKFQNLRGLPPSPSPVDIAKCCVQPHNSPPTPQHFSGFFQLERGTFVHRSLVSTLTVTQVADLSILFKMAPGRVLVIAGSDSSGGAYVAPSHPQLCLSRFGSFEYLSE